MRDFITFFAVVSCVEAADAPGNRDDEQRLKRPLPETLLQSGPGGWMGISRFRVDENNEVILGTSARVIHWKDSLLSRSLGVFKTIKNTSYGDPSSPLLIASTRQPFVIDGVDYSWNAFHKRRIGEYLCLLPFEELIEAEKGFYLADKLLLSKIRFENGSSPYAISWGCFEQNQVCCGIECCPDTTLEDDLRILSRALSLLFVIAIFVLVCDLVIHRCQKCYCSDETQPREENKLLEAIRRSSRLPRHSMSSFSQLSRRPSSLPSAAIPEVVILGNSANHTPPSCSSTSRGI